MKQVPETKQEAVDILIRTLDPVDKEFIQMSFRDDIHEFLPTLGATITKDFNMLSGNDTLISDCCGNNKHTPENAAFVIIRDLWETLQE